jgi:outer membrane receptor for ferrienterochelin and colicin
MSYTGCGAVVCWSCVLSFWAKGGRVKSNSWLHGFAVWLLSSAFMSGVQAQDFTLDELLDMDLADLMKIKITSSTMTEESLKTVPASMTVYTRRDIHRLGIKSLAALVNFVPGYQSYRTDGDSLNRGISSRGLRASSASNQILVLIDGQRLNDDWNGGSGRSNSLISLENIERVEFIRGPGSAIYGSNAMTGVINIITRSERELLLESGTEQRQHASLQWHADGELAEVAVYAAHAQSNGENISLFQPSSGTFVDSHDPYRADDLYVRLHAGEFSLSARAITRDTQEFYSIGSLDQASNYYDSSADSINLGWKHPISAQMNVEGHIFQSHQNFQLRTDLRPTVPGFIVEGGIKEEEQGTQWVLQGGQENIRWLLGWEWRKPQLTDTSAHLGTLQDPYATVAMLSQAPENGREINSQFAQLQVNISDTLVLTTGMRHDDYSDFGGHSSPRVGLVQQLGTADTLKVLYSEAFRAPNRSESSVTNSSAILQNPDLKPETTKTTELIWLHMLADGFISSTVFDNNIQDAIVPAAVSNTQRQPVNSTLSVAGVEVEWQQHWNNRWQSRVAGTYLFDSVGELHTQSDFLLGGYISYEYRNWMVTLLGNYQGAMVDPNEQDPAPGDANTVESTHFNPRTVYAAHVSYHTLRQIELYLHGDNLLDEKYVSPADSPSNYVGVPEVGRVVSAGVRWEF